MMILYAAYTSIESEDAIRAGFKKAWQERDYAVIVAVADKFLNNVLKENPKLLMWYDQAV
ncbi:hypothetical protein JWG42_13675 [Desulfoprunum benzoelyticum]|uniref:Uncharacterized protein n=1 Tax=Desulfoprunum benzoelyticum TaxID=1506996 RepID=A0A840UUF8_9BACT|nr:hypothetical protein [Desulfoprunum benzoelyticum]MBB5349422.1 hypothetical protein [Desulfoprunum benzoelyticum]MBM9531204.1 hypothetical protein [Desulfoprunum benzoelyticum]